MTQINIQFTLFSAFYSPLISTISGGFLKEQGLEPEWSVARPGTSALQALKDGTAHVVQSALSQGFGTADQDRPASIVHFAQVNEMDGFFITGRESDPDFSWHKLEGAEVLLFGGGQPLAMFKYACYKAGIDYNKIKAIHPGGAADIDRAFRAGEGTYVQQQGPFPQQLETDGIGHIVAAVGPKVGACGFSSLAANREWLQTDMAKAFTRAYQKTRTYINTASAEEIARAEQPYFPKVAPDALVRCIDAYQRLGCWTPHIEITDQAYQATLDIYDYNGGLDQRYDYNEICARPPVI